MRIQFLGAAKEVGRSCIIIDDKYMLDAGLKLTDEGSEYPLEYNTEKIKAVFIGHAHLDHTGALPLFNHLGLKCSIYCTKMTKLLTKILLRDSFHIGLLEKQHPAYTKDNINNVMSFMQNIRYDKEYAEGDVKFTYIYAGHIPGSASILIEFGGKRILYTGDINFINTELMDGANYALDNIDIMISESTYGDRDHPKREKEEKDFLDKVQETVERGGSVLIPAFSVGRAQEVMLMLRKIRINAPVYLDGMAKEVTDILLDMPEYIKDGNALKNAAKKVEYVRDRKDRENIVRSQGVFITTSGMLEGGPVMDYLKYFYHDEKNSILLTGFQTQHCNGRMLLDEGKIIVDGNVLKVKCEVAKFDFSAHSGRVELIKLINSINPKHLVLQHGDKEAVEALELYFKGKIDVHAPELGEKLDL